MFSYGFCKIFQNSYSVGHLRTADFYTAIDVGLWSLFRTCCLEVFFRVLDTATLIKNIFYAAFAAFFRTALWETAMFIVEVK